MDRLSQYLESMRSLAREMGYQTALVVENGTIAPASAINPFCVKTPDGGRKDGARALVDPASWKRWLKAWVESGAPYDPPCLSWTRASYDFNQWMRAELEQSWAQGYQAAMEDVK